MDVIKTHESDDLILFEVYYNRAYKYDTIIIIQKLGGIIHKTKAEIKSIKKYKYSKYFHELIKEVVK